MANACYVSAHKTPVYLKLKYWSIYNGNFPCCVQVCSLMPHTGTRRYRISCWGKYWDL